MDQPDFNLVPSPVEDNQSQPTFPYHAESVVIGERTAQNKSMVINKKTQQIKFKFLNYSISSSAAKNKKVYTSVSKQH